METLAFDEISSSEEEDEDSPEPSLSLSPQRNRGRRRRRSTLPIYWGTGREMAAEIDDRSRPVPITQQLKEYCAALYCSLIGQSLHELVTYSLMVAFWQCWALMQTAST
jgi:hypothetical protein